MPADGPEVLAGVHGPGHPGTSGTLNRRRILYLVTTAALTALIALAAGDAAGLLDTYGISTSHERAAGGGYQLDVEYATVSRPGLATPFDVEVRRTGGFEGPVTIAVSLDYLAHWDEYGFYPTPSTETTHDGWLLWTFEPPAGEAFRFAYDGRITAGLQRGASGQVAVIDAGSPVAVVSIRTRILP